MIIDSGNKIVLGSKDVDDKRITIFLDLDDVCVAFSDSFAELLDIDVEENLEVRNRLKNGEDWYNIIGGEKGWKAINNAGEKWWENLGTLPWANDLVKALSKMGDIMLLSSPGEDYLSAAYACAGKCRWLKKNLPDIPYAFAHDKWTFANNKTILIDDSPRKLVPFKRDGGFVYHWPNPYSIIDGDKKVDMCISEIDLIIKNMKSQ